MLTTNSCSRKWEEPSQRLEILTDEGGQELICKPNSKPVNKPAVEPHVCPRAPAVGATTSNRQAVGARTSNRSCVGLELMRWV